MARAIVGIVVLLGGCFRAHPPPLPEDAGTSCGTDCPRPVPWDPAEDPVWECTARADGSTECVDWDPERPDGGDWRCYFDNGFDDTGDDAIVCEGHLEDEVGPLWDCYDGVEQFVLCRRASPPYPDDGGDEKWTCWMDEEGSLHCSTEGESIVEPRIDEPDCVIGSESWCDGPMFSSWGKRICDEDGNWSACLEEDGDRPGTICACRRFYFDSDCCETPDCIVPADHVTTICESDGGLCGYCTTDDDCAGGGICVEDGGGATMCGVPCVGEGQGDCPDGFSCAPIRDYYGDVVALQCVPLDLRTCDGG